jgi:2-oxoglutarate dehydrogenase E2 component (dihydrolipoamide succinyltransferase)
MRDIIAPPLGEGVSEAILASWLKRPGDRVAKGEGLLVLETDKASVEVSADVEGVVAAVFIDAGESVAVGAILGRIEEAPRP